MSSSGKKQSNLRQLLAELAQRGEIMQGGVDVAAGEDDDCLVCGGELVGVEEGGGESDGAGGLGDEGGAGEQDAHGGEDLVFGDGDDARNVAEDVVEVEGAEGLGAEAVAEGAGGELGGPLDEGAGVEGFVGVGGEGGLGAPDLNVGVAEAGCRRRGGWRWRCR